MACRCPAAWLTVRGRNGAAVGNGNWECRGRGARGRERSWEPLGLVVGRSAGFCVWPRRAGCVIFLIPFDLPSCAACGLRRGA